MAKDKFLELLQLDSRSPSLWNVALISLVISFGKVSIELDETGSQ
jgi:hypothetical protein